MITMKALRSFGVPGANEGYVRRGREFSAASENRAKDLEEHGLAHRVVETKTEPPPLNKMEPPPANKAADAGPLDSVGGETGAETAPSSSAQDRPQRQRRSKKSPAGLEF